MTTRGRLFVLAAGSVLALGMNPIAEMIFPAAPAPPPPLSIPGRLESPANPLPQPPSLEVTVLTTDPANLKSAALRSFRQGVSVSHIASPESTFSGNGWVTFRTDTAARKNALRAWLARNHFSAGSFAPHAGP